MGARYSAAGVRRGGSGSLSDPDSGRSSDHAIQPTGSSDSVLRGNADFRRLYNCGTSVRASDVVVVYLSTPSSRLRIGVVASRKVGSSVRRNRAKRVLREAHRQLRHSMKSVGADLALIARTNTPDRSMWVIRDQLADLYREAGFLREEDGPDEKQPCEHGGGTNPAATSVHRLAFR